MFLTYKYRLKGKRIGRRLSAQARSVNKVWNYCTKTQKTVNKLYKQGSSIKWHSYFDFTKLTAGTSKDLCIHAQTINAICKQFVRSRDQHKKCPRFRKSYTSKRSLGWIPFTSQSRKIVANSIKYFGYTYKLFGIKNRPLPDVVKGGQFAEDSKGRWYVCLQVEVQPDNNHGNKEIGVDLGLKTLVTTSDGEKYANPSYFRKSEQKLKVAQRANNKKQVRNIHAKIKNQRKDYNHKLSNKLIGESSLIIVGNVKATFGQKGLRKAGLDASWSGLREMLRYKASRHGVKYLEVNEAYTTQTCSHCGQRPPGRPKGIAGLGIREWTCSLCGSTHDRDVNAAKNILILGRGAAPPVEGSLAVKANSNRISTNLYGMKLSARPLIDIDDVNDFRYSTQLEFHSGDATTFYFQLVDQDKNPAQQGFYPSGLRYCPIASATLQVTFINISDSKQFIRFASQPFANDTSIWSVPLLATDPLEGTISIKCVLSENTGTEEAPVTRTRTFNLPASILVAV